MVICGLSPYPTTDCMAEAAPLYYIGKPKTSIARKTNDVPESQISFSFSLWSRSIKGALRVFSVYRAHWQWSVEGHSKVIQCISDFDNLNCKPYSKMASRRAKLTRIWASIVIKSGYFWLLSLQGHSDVIHFNNLVSQKRLLYSETDKNLDLIGKYLLYSGYALDR